MLLGIGYYVNYVFKVDTWYVIVLLSQSRSCLLVMYRVSYLPCIFASSIFQFYIFVGKSCLSLRRLLQADFRTASDIPSPPPLAVLRPNPATIGGDAVQPSSVMGTTWDPPAHASHLPPPRGTMFETTNNHRSNNAIEQWTAIAVGAATMTANGTSDGCNRINVSCGIAGVWGQNGREWRGEFLQILCSRSGFRKKHCNGQ